MEPGYLYSENGNFAKSLSIVLSDKLQFTVQMETVIKKLALIIVAIFFVSYSCETLYAQERNKGYQGSVSYSNMAFLWNGLETSHGYMFNAHHYLGAGVGVLTTIPISKPNAFIGHIFVDYHAYWFERNSSPTAGIKIGYLCSFPDKSNLQNLEIELNIGWSWLLKSGNGLALSLGVNVVPEPVAFTENNSFPITIAPCLHFGFEF